MHLLSPELSSGITTARGCGVGGDLVQCLQVTNKKNLQFLSLFTFLNLLEFHPPQFLLCQGTPYVFWENSVCFSRPGFNDTQEVKSCSTLCTKSISIWHRCASVQGMVATRITPPPEPRMLTIQGLENNQTSPLEMVSPHQFCFMTKTECLKV